MQQFCGSFEGQKTIDCQYPCRLNPYCLSGFLADFFKMTQNERKTGKSPRFSKFFTISAMYNTTGTNPLDIVKNKNNKAPQIGSQLYCKYFLNFCDVLTSLKTFLAGGQTAPS